MRLILKLLGWLTALVGIVIIGGAGWLLFAPPDLIRVGSAYSAKVVCSNVFLADRDPQDVLRVDVQSPGHPLLRLMRVDIDREAGTVSASLFGVFGQSLAVHREGLGCTSVPDGNPDAVVDLDPGSATSSSGMDLEVAPDPTIEAILADDAMVGPGVRGVVVMRGGRVVAERYGDGFSRDTPLLGWSMTKTVTAAILGTLFDDGRLSREDSGLFEEWAGDRRASISIADLMAMSSGLQFNEDYGDVTDVTRMLYLQSDMAAFAADKGLGGLPGNAWSYSSGTSVLLSRIWQKAAGGDAGSWPRERLFAPLGMSSAVLEPDASGTFVGSSYLYATARDWARFGQMMLQDGVWNGREVLSADFVRWMREEAPASRGEYGRGQLWLHGPQAGTPAGQDPDEGFDLPPDAFWFLGHDGQSTAVVPSLELVVVRLGLTPSRLGYKPQRMLEAIAKALPAAGQGGSGVNASGG